MTIWLLIFHPQKCKYMRQGNVDVDIKEYRLKEDDLEPTVQTKEEKNI